MRQGLPPTLHGGACAIGSNDCYVELSCIGFFGLLLSVLCSMQVRWQARLWQHVGIKPPTAAGKGVIRFPVLL